jgi:hypothetical protein
MDTQKEKEKYKLIICVFACATIPQYKNEIKKIEETWGARAIKKNIKVLYFLGEEKTDLDDYSKYIYLKNVGNDYSSAMDKQNLGLKYIYENFITDFIYCCGTDTYVNVDNMLNYINTFDSNDALYIGGHGSHRTINDTSIYFHCGGAGFIISLVALSAVYSKLEHINAEWFKMCSDSNNGDLNVACDVALSYYLQNIIGSELKIIENKISFFGCNYKGIVHHKNVGMYYTCCNNIINWKTLISCHCMTSSDFDEFTKILEEHNYYSI